ncbi:MAG: septum site-determining protein MinC [Roseiarcus sp.]
MNTQVGRTSAISFAARSLLAFALEPTAPLKDWFAALDAWLARSPNFFCSKPVILQMGGLEIGLKEYRALLGDLARRHIRVMAAENAGRTLVGPHLPPVVSGGRVVSVDKLFEEEPTVVAPPAAAPRPPVSFVHDGNLRSGQQIVHIEGDVTVLGRVASGAEIVAGGTVHVYGALQGRVFAGVSGAQDARIFCREARAELLCIGGVYVTAEDMDASFDGRAVEASIDGGKVRIRVLN